MIGFIMCVHPCPILGPPLISAGWCACALVLTEVGVFYLLWQLKDGEDTVAEEPQCVPARRGALVEEDLLWCYWYGLWRPYSCVIVASGCLRCMVWIFIFNSCHHWYLGSDNSWANYNVYAVRAWAAVLSYDLHRASGMICHSLCVHGWLLLPPFQIVDRFGKI